MTGGGGISGLPANPEFGGVKTGLVPASELYAAAEYSESGPNLSLELCPAAHEEFENVAHTVLSVETLATLNSDRVDFYDVFVRYLIQALKINFHNRVCNYFWRFVDMPRIPLSNLICSEPSLRSPLASQILFHKTYGIHGCFDRRCFR